MDSLVFLHCLHPALLERKLTGSLKPSTSATTVVTSKNFSEGTNVAIIDKAFGGEQRVILTLNCNWEMYCISVAIWETFWHWLIFFRCGAVGANHWYRSPSPFGMLDRRSRPKCHYMDERRTSAAKSPSIRRQSTDPANFQLTNGRLRHVPVFRSARPSRGPSVLGIEIRR